MSWTKKNVHPGKIVSTSQEVEVQVLDVDPKRRRISLGLKQCMENPWEGFAKRYPSGATIEGEIKNITEFGLFIGLEEGVDGMVHMSDLSWDKTPEAALAEFHKGDMVKAKVLDVDLEKERISLGVKQLVPNPLEAPVAAGAGPLRKGQVVTVRVEEIQDQGIEVSVADTGVRTFIRRGDLSRDRSEQRPERFSVGNKVDAKITNIDRAGRKITLSIKAREIDEEKEAVAQYGSSVSGASLGDILGAALRAKDKEEAADD
jgi:small subunit ribosomal protein S1